MRKSVWKTALAPLAMAAITAAAANGGNPGMVEDINPTWRGIAAFEPTDVNGTLFFDGFINQPGSRALWKSDGTAAGTVVLKKINPTGPSAIGELTAAGGKLFFRADDGVNGVELWKSDGTAAGTAMVKDIYPGSGGSGFPSGIVSHNGMVFFSAGDATNGVELWKSDGTEAGTVMVKDIFAAGDSNPTGITSAGSHVYFSAKDAVNGRELWKSDGTDVGTVMVKDIFPGGDAMPYGMTAVNGIVYFAARASIAGGFDLWRTDGTEAGTVIVKHINTNGGATPSFLTEMGGKLYFCANDGEHGYELWKSDGTESGTVMVKDINPTGSSNPFNIVGMGAAIYFRADDGVHGAELWKSDGTEVGTVMLADINPSGNALPALLTVVGSTLYFCATDGVHGRQVWSTTGSTAVMATDLNSGKGCAPAALAAVGSALYFTAIDGSGGPELRKFDGKSLVTFELFPCGSFPSDKSALSSNLLFQADDGTHGAELWLQNTAADSAAMVKDINPSGSSWPTLMTSMDSFSLFSANDGVYGMELWRTDGTEAGTSLVKDINGSGSSAPSSLTRSGASMYFVANDGVTGRELWRTDGTASGTSLVKDINPSGLSKISFLADLGGALLFNADDGANGSELWKTDGTASGTAIVKDINPGTGGSIPANLVKVGAAIFFNGDDGTTGRELWKSDGTADGTVLVKDINPAGDSSPTSIVNLNGVAFFVADDGVNGVELWKSDGTAVGTVMVKNINPAGDAYPYSLVAVGGRLFFGANDGVSGVELWKTDGTEFGTVMVKDIGGLAGSFPSNLTAVESYLYFFASDEIRGRNLWCTDGTESGTVWLGDINPDLLNIPYGMAAAGGDLLFSAYDATYGYELWDYMPQTLSIVASPAEGGVVHPIDMSMTYAGQEIAITATPNTGYTFYNWTVTGSATVAKPNLGATTLAVGVGSAIATANFVKQSDTQTAVLFVKAQPLTAGSASPAGSTSQKTGQAIAITATPRTGYFLTAWISYGNAVIADPKALSTTITLYGDATATALFTCANAACSVTVSASPVEGGTASVETSAGDAPPRAVPSASVPLGSAVKLRATANAGWSFIGWSLVGAGAVDNDRAASAVLIANGDTAATARFAKDADVCLLTVTGQCTPSGTITVVKGEPVKIFARPLAGYVFYQWTAIVSADFADKYAAATTVIITSDTVVQPEFNEGEPDAEDSKVLKIDIALNTAKENADSVKIAKFPVPIYDFDPAAGGVIVLIDGNAFKVDHTMGKFKPETAGAKKYSFTSTDKTYSMSLDLVKGLVDFSASRTTLVIDNSNGVDVLFYFIPLGFAANFNMVEKVNVSFDSKRNASSALAVAGVPFAQFAVDKLALKIDSTTNWKDSFNITKASFQFPESVRFDPYKDTVAFALDDLSIVILPNSWKVGKAGAYSYKSDPKDKSTAAVSATLDTEKGQWSLSVTKACLGAKISAADGIDVRMELVGKASAGSHLQSAGTVNLSYKKK